MRDTTKPVGYLADNQSGHPYIPVYAGEDGVLRLQPFEIAVRTAEATVTELRGDV